MKKNKSKKNKLNVEFVPAKGVSEEESQRRWDAVFDILFEEVFERRHKKNNG